MADLLRKPLAKLDIKENRYKRLYFTRNPFPNSPGVNIGSADPRENGTIYYPELIKNEEKQFEKLLIPEPTKSETNQIVFLMDYATRQGRGIGKTAFLNHERNRIMGDLGEELTRGSYVIFAVYVLPIPGENYNHFWKISRLIIKSLLEQDIISMALCRLRAFSDYIPDDVLDKGKDDLLGTLGNDGWLQENNVNTWELNIKIFNDLEKLNIDADLAENLAYLGCDNSKFITSYFNKLMDSFWRKNGNKFLFHDLVKLFCKAGFTKGIILLDELEKIFSPLNSRERRTFIESIRYYFLDGDNQNCNQSFFELLLTIHPYLQELMIPHWSAAGLERFAALGGDSSQNYTIYFKLLLDSFAVPLAKEYLKYSRMPAEGIDNLFPFEEDALKHALKISNNVPGKYLSFLHQIVEKAIDENWKKIGIDEIDIVANRMAPEEPEISNNDEPLTPPYVKLK